MLHIHKLFPTDNKCGAGHSLGAGGAHTSIARRTMAIRGKSTATTICITTYTTADLDVDDKGLGESRRWRCLADGHAHVIAQCLDAPPGLPPTPPPLFARLVTAHFLPRDLTDVCSCFLTVSRRVY